MERGCLRVCVSAFVCVCVRERAWVRLSSYALCAECSCAVPSRGKLCVSVWWGNSRERCGLTRSSSVCEDHHLAEESLNSMIILESHCWQQPKWRWQPTCGLPCATVAALKEETQPCESDSAAGNSWTCFPGQNLDFFQSLNLFFFSQFCLAALNLPMRRGLKAGGTREVSGQRTTAYWFLFVHLLVFLWKMNWTSLYLHRHLQEGLEIGSKMPVDVWSVFNRSWPMFIRPKGGDHHTHAQTPYLSFFGMTFIVRSGMFAWQDVPPVSQCCDYCLRTWISSLKRRCK